MTYSGISYGFGLVANGSAVGVHSSLSGPIGTPIEIAAYATPPDIVYPVTLQIAAGDTLTWNAATGVITGTVAGAYQKETTTIVAAGGCTSDGNLALAITAAGLTGSPLTVNVPLTIATHTTQDLIAAQCRTTLAATAAVTAFFAVGGSTNTFTLEKLAKQANDATFAVVTPTALGVTGSTSANTTAGAAVSMAYRIPGTVWDAKDPEGVTLLTATKLYSTLIKVSSISASSGVQIGIGLDRCVTLQSVGEIDEAINPLGVHIWNGESVDFLAISGDVTLTLDVHAGT